MRVSDSLEKRGTIAQITQPRGCNRIPEEMVCAQVFLA